MFLLSAAAGVAVKDLVLALALVPWYRLLAYLFLRVQLR
jgi:hypothetical protein